MIIIISLHNFANQSIISAGDTSVYVEQKRVITRKFEFGFSRRYSNFFDSVIVPPDNKRKKNIVVVYMNDK